MNFGVPYFMTNKEWFRKNPQTGKLELTEKATPEAIKSFKEFYEQYNKSMNYVYGFDKKEEPNLDKLFGVK